MDDSLPIDAKTVLDCLGDGVYVTDRERRIVYWNKAAERITGWKAEDVYGHSCYENILCHVDKDGRRLCGREYCPLHRSIVTGMSSECPLMFAKAKDGRRLPMQTTVSPLCNEQGEIIGGVEVFRDLSTTFRDLDRARAIQAISMQSELPHDPRIDFATHYIPHDVVGGDYCNVRQLSPDVYGFFLADVMGHGIAAALYTMYLSALWDRYYATLTHPVTFAEKLNNELNRVVRGREAFAAGVCGVIDLRHRKMRFVGAGNPPALLIQRNGEFSRIPCAGVPLGIMKDAPYEATQLHIEPGSRFLFYSDGATEVYNVNDAQLGVEGLIELLKSLDYPHADIQVSAIEVALLKYSNALRLEDDLTFLEIRLDESLDTHAQTVDALT